MSLTHRQRLAHLLRRLHLLQLADTFCFLRACWETRAANKKFRAEHPEVPVPPMAVLYDIQGNCDLNGYHQSGKEHAFAISRLIAEMAPAGPLRILEWGCGPARVLQHICSPQGNCWELAGSDYNRETIAWCQCNLPEIQFLHNGLKPPIAAESGTFDVFYCISVFTHLSEESHHQWISEILRLLRPGGLFIGTFHGDFFRDQLTIEEQQRYDAGELVIRGNIAEGKKNFSAYHCDNALRRLLSPFAVARKENVSGFSQSVWIAVKR